MYSRYTLAWIKRKHLIVFLLIQSFKIKIYVGRLEETKLIVLLINRKVINKTKIILSNLTIFFLICLSINV